MGHITKSRLTTYEHHTNKKLQVMIFENWFEPSNGNRCLAATNEATFLISVLRNTRANQFNIIQESCFIFIFVHQQALGIPWDSMSYCIVQIPGRSILYRAHVDSAGDKNTYGALKARRRML